MTLRATREQQAIVDAIASGSGLVVQAGAGTGKSSTLRMASERVLTGKNCLYMVYNKAAQLEAASSFPSHVHCSTLHKLAWDASSDLMKEKVDLPREKPWEVAEQVGIGHRDLDGVRNVKPWQIVSWAQDAIKAFCYSGAPSLERRHVEFALHEVEGLSEDAGIVLSDLTLKAAERLWEESYDPNSRRSFTLDMLLKHFALSEPTLPFDVILVDESQDSNELTESLVKSQGAQVILVGDQLQQLYSWRGSVDIAKRFRAFQQLYLTQSFRFGEAVAEAANLWLSALEAPFRLTGNPRLPSVIDDGAFYAEDRKGGAILCRTNAQCLQEAIPLMGAGKKIHLRNADSLSKLLKAFREIKEKGKTTYKPLCLFTSWEEISEYAQTSSGRDLLMPVKMVNVYGLSSLETACRATVPLASADLVISTQHSTKGLEFPAVLTKGVRQPADVIDWDEGEIRWDEDADGKKVRVETATGKRLVPGVTYRMRDGRAVSAATDHVLGLSTGPGTLARSEGMLGYVATTRAQMLLDRGDMAWIGDYVKSLT